jgi:glycosyltransferase involved in cell wall biosynthesis
MREYVVVAGDFVLTGGMDRANYALVRHLAESGRSVQIVAFCVASEIRALPNVRVHLVPKPARSYSLGAPLLGIVGIAATTIVGRRGGCVVVNGGNCPARGLNWVHYVHAAHEPEVAVGGWRAARAAAAHRVALGTERRALRKARIVVTNSNRTRRDVVERVGVDADRVRTVYYGIDADRFRPPTEGEAREARRTLGWPEGTARVAFIGALGDRRKAFDVVYAAWRDLCARPSWDAELVVVGAGTELPAWRARAVEDRIDGRIRFLGFRNDVPQILAASDALVAPTRYEAYGLGVHEALCCGLPALVSASAGVAERYPDAMRALLLEDNESAQSVAASLLGWRERTTEHAAAVRRFSDELRGRGWSDMARDIADLCEGA